MEPQVQVQGTALNKRRHSGEGERKRPPKPPCKCLPIGHSDDLSFPRGRTGDSKQSCELTPTLGVQEPIKHILGPQ